MEGYTVHVRKADAAGVDGELMRASRTSLAFTILADEHQFEVSAVLRDIQLSFAQYIRLNALSPSQPLLELKYP